MQNWLGVRCPPRSWLGRNEFAGAWASSQSFLLRTKPRPSLPYCLASSPFVGDHAPPQTLGTPDSRAQTFELHDLAVIDEQVHFRAVILDVPGEDFGIRSFKHHFLRAEGIRDLGRHLCPPCFHIF